MSGDFNSMLLSSTGGDDKITGGNGGDHISGDVHFYMQDSFGGDDTIKGGNWADEIYGDAREMKFSEGGIDIINAGSGADTIYGDAYSANGSIGGNDVINGDAGNDLIWGDFLDYDGVSTGGGAGGVPSQGGNDIFVFTKGSGEDTIWDFDFSGDHDLIDLRAYHLTWDQLSTKITDNGSVADIQLTKSDSIDVHHLEGYVLQQTDFIL